MISYSAIKLMVHYGSVSWWFSGSKKLILLILLCSSCTPSDSSQNKPEPLVIYAATSLTSVMPQLEQGFLQRYPEARIEFSFAASSMLAKQIEHGAEADIYISANSDWVDYLERKNRIAPDSRFDLLSNRLVLIVPYERNGAEITLDDLEKPSITHIALADWTHVPAGIYAKKALESLGVWDTIKSKCIPALDVRAALSYVARNEADCGIVYRTDAAISKKVRITSELPDEIQPKIRYPVALTNDGGHPLIAYFLSYLRSEEGKNLFEKNGFEVIESPSDE